MHEQQRHWRVNIDRPYTGAPLHWHVRSVYCRVSLTRQLHTVTYNSLTGDGRTRLQNAAGVAHDIGRPSSQHGSNLPMVAHVAADHTYQCSSTTAEAQRGRTSRCGCRSAQSCQGRRRVGATAASEEEELSGAAPGQPGRHEEAQTAQAAADDGAVDCLLPPGMISPRGAQNDQSIKIRTSSSIPIRLE